MSRRTRDFLLVAGVGSAAIVILAFKLMRVRRRGRGAARLYRRRPVVRAALVYFLRRDEPLLMAAGATRSCQRLGARLESESVKSLDVARFGLIALLISPVFAQSPAAPTTPTPAAAAIPEPARSDQGHGRPLDLEKYKATIKGPHAIRRIAARARIATRPRSTDRGATQELRLHQYQRGSSMTISRPIRAGRVDRRRVAPAARRAVG